MKAKLKQTFIPGDEWVYFKVYLTPPESNAVLANYIYPIISHELSKKHIDRWFFIRYTDPGYHLRVRMHLVEKMEIGSVINFAYRKLNPLVLKGIISKITIDTYVREIERYGHDTMELCESFFCSDSNFIASVIKYASNNENNLDWKMGVFIADSLLKGFFPNLNDRFLFISKISDNYNAEFGYKGGSLKTVNELYRKYRKDVETILSNFEILPKELIKHNFNYSLFPKITINQIVPSLLHMSFNRLYPTHQRMFEMVIYNFLRTAYKGQLSRNID